MSILDVLRGKRDYGFESQNVQDFGANGDNTDQTTAIQNAIDALGDNGTLFFNPGKYKISSTLTISGKSNIRVVGNGAVLVNEIDSADYVVFKFTTLTGLSIKDLNVDMNDDTTNDGTALDISVIEGIVSIEGVSIYNFGTPQTKGIYLNDINYNPLTSQGSDFPGIRILNCTFWNDIDSGTFDYDTNTANGIGVYADENAEYGSIQGCGFTFITCGLYSTGGANWRVIGNDLTYIDPRSSKASTTADYGAIYYASSAFNNGKCMIQGNNFNHNYGPSIKSDYVNAGRPLTITGNQFIANSYSGIVINGTDMCQINDNFFNRCWNYLALPTWPFTGYIAAMIDMDDTDYTMIADNNFLSQVGYVVRTTGTSDYNRLSGNTTKDVNNTFLLVGSNNITHENYDY